MATAIDYDPQLSVRTARARYFADNGFGDDGGYSAKWVTIFQVGPIPLGFPQTAGRLRAVCRHDLHHLATGYDTDIVGEGEIAAWELGSDCQDFTAAWVLNTIAMPIGVIRQPARIRQAFARGCNSRNLYAEPFTDALLDERLGALRERLNVGLAANVAITPEQLARYRWFVFAGFFAGAVMLAMLALVLVGLVMAILALIGAIV